MPMRTIRASFFVASAIVLAGCASHSTEPVPAPAKPLLTPLYCNSPCTPVPRKTRNATIEQVTGGGSDEEHPPVYTKTCQLFGVEMHYSRCQGPISCGGGGAGNVTYFRKWLLQSVPVGSATSCNDSLFTPIVFTPINGVEAKAGEAVPSIDMASIFAPGALTLSVTSPDWLRIEEGQLSGQVPNTPGVSVPVTVRAYNRNGAVESTFPLIIR